MKINYWSDIACPYCYIAETNIKRALETLHLDKTSTLQMRAYELSPSAPLLPNMDTQERLEHKYHISQAESLRRLKQIDRTAHAAGLDMDCTGAVRTNTRRAHRLIKLAQAQGDAATSDAVIEDLYKAYFAEHLNVSDPEVLIAIGERHGFARSDVEAMLSGEAFLSEVLADEHQARRMGISGVPFFLIDDRYAFSGAMSIQQMVVILHKVAREEMTLEEKAEPETKTA